MDRRDARAIVVVDTNVIACYLFKTKPHADETVTLWKGGWEIHSPAVWETEIANVAWKIARQGLTDLATCVLRLDLARRLDIVTTRVRDLWEDALVTALAADLPVYDASFVALAERLDAPLVTFDKRILDRFPKRAVRPRDLTP